MANILEARCGEASMMACCTGKTNLHNLEPEDLRALTLATAEATDILLGNANGNAMLFALAENDEGCKGKRTGGCQCGEVRYESEGEPLALYVCHCRECRRQSASAIGISLIVPRKGLRVTQGAAKFWARPTDSGGRVECAFCPNCGSRLWHESEGGSETVSIKGGSLDEAPNVSAAIHIWTSRKLPGVDIPHSAQQFPEEPD